MKNLFNSLKDKATAKHQQEPMSSAKTGLIGAVIAGTLAAGFLAIKHANNMRAMKV